MEVGPKIQNLIDNHNAQFAIDEDTGRITVQEIPSHQISTSDYSAVSHDNLDISSKSPYFVKNILQTQLSDAQRK